MKYIFILLILFQPFFTQAQETTDYDFFSFMMDGLSLNMRIKSTDMRMLREVITENNDILTTAMNVETDPEFIPYIEKYIQLKGEPLSYPVKIRFFHTNNEIALEMFGRGKNGYCDPLTRTIFIIPDEWEKFSYPEKEMLILHELGHCDLNRKHEKDNTSLDRLPFSLMQTFRTSLLLGMRNTHSNRHTNSGVLVESMSISEAYTFPEDIIFEEIYPPLYSELFSKRNTLQDPISPEQAQAETLVTFLSTRNSIIFNGYMLNFFKEEYLVRLYIVIETLLNQIKNSRMAEVNKENLWQVFRRMVRQAKNTSS